MRSLLLGRRTLFWLILIAATLCSVDLSSNLLPSTRIRTASLLVLVITSVKVSIVGFEFMELRHAPILARVAFQVWSAGICIAIIVTLLAGWHA